MSGGHFDYVQYQFNEVAEEIDRLIKINRKGGLMDSGDYYDYDFSDATMTRFREAAHTVRLAQQMVQRIDWLVSGDDGEEAFHKRWKKEVNYDHSITPR